ncbi:MAG: MFS transporter [Candidatus Lokiarchaeota archaeon]|nr:MFS transporter [Candidatus Lokiarchaeota archaeon]
MNERAAPRSFAFPITTFITVVAIVYAIQNLIAPNLEYLSVLFGFGGETTPLGSVQFSFMMTSGVVMVVFGYLADKLARVRILFAGTLLFSVPSVLVALVGAGITGYVLFFILQMVSGAGLGMTIPVTFSLTGDIVPQNDRAKGFSYFSIATLLGGVVASVLAGIVPASQWKVLYIGIGIAGIMASVMSFFLKEPNRVGRDYLYTSGKESVEYSYRIRRADLNVIVKKRTNIWLIINFVDTIPTGIILFLLYKYMKDFHNVEKDMTLVFLAFVLIGTLVGTIVFGSIADRLFKKGNKRARVLLALFANVTPIPFVFIAFLVPFWFEGATIIDLFMIPGAVLTITLLTVGLFLNGATNGSWYATVVDINLPEHRGTVLATANFFDIIGKSIGPLIGTMLSDTFGVLVGINVSIIFWCALPFFWIGVLRHFTSDLEATDTVFKERLEGIKGNG